MDEDFRYGISDVFVILLYIYNLPIMIMFFILYLMGIKFRYKYGLLNSKGRINPLLICSVFSTFVYFGVRAVFKGLIG